MVFARPRPGHLFNMAEKGAHGTQRWTGDTPGGAEVAEPSRWVVWGTGAPLEGEGLALASDDDIAQGIARGVDPEWEREEKRWVVIATADESSIDALVGEERRIRGYAAYLVEGKGDEMPASPMRGTLRSDVGPRRKVDQPRPT
jgi:hypothetical protein